MILQNTRFIGADHRLHRKDIRIEGTTIVEIDGNLRMSAGEELLDCTDLLVIPALADCHVHSPDTILKGLFNGVEMTRWCDESPLGRLQASLFDYLDECVHTPEFKIMVLYAYIQYLHNGVGFIVETGQADDSHRILQACAEDIGLKAAIDWYDEVPSTPSSCQRLTTTLHLNEEEDLTADSLRTTVCLREEHPEMLLMTHCLENAWRLEEVKRKFGVSTVRLMHDQRLLDERAVLFHCIQVSDEDIGLLAQQKANVVCCPVSSMRIGEGFMPVGKILARNVKIMLGTDFLDHDIWDCMRFLHTELSSSEIPVAEPAAAVFDMASKNAAQIARQVGYSGTIAVGAAADLCFLQYDHRFEPLVEQPFLSNALHNILATGHANLVRHVMIDGRFVLKDGMCTTVDEGSILAQYEHLLAERFDHPVF